MHEILLKAGMITLRFMEVYTLIHVPAAVGWFGRDDFEGSRRRGKTPVFLPGKESKKGLVSEGRKEPQRKSLISSGGMRAGCLGGLCSLPFFLYRLTKHDKLKPPLSFGD